MFQVDEEDVNKLLETEETEGVVPVEQGSEERTDLEDVFRWKNLQRCRRFLNNSCKTRFDSEMHEDEEDEEAAAQVGEQQVVHLLFIFSLFDPRFILSILCFLFLFLLLLIMMIIIGRGRRA